MGVRSYDYALSETSDSDDTIDNNEAIQGPANGFSIRSTAVQVIRGNSEVISTVMFDVGNDMIKVTHDDHRYFLSASLLRAQFPRQDSVQLIAGALGRYSHATIRLFGRWLEQNKLTPLHPRDATVAEAQLLEYIKLYKLASDKHINNLINEIMDRIRARPTCGIENFPAFLIKECYKASTPAAPLRRYLVDSFIFNTKTWTATRRVHMIRYHLDASSHNQKFVED